MDHLDVTRFFISSFDSNYFPTFQVGHRRSIATGGTIYGLGWLVIAGGVHTHSLPLIYTGNLLCGLGYGATYTPPLQVSVPIF